MDTAWQHADRDSEVYGDTTGPIVPVLRTLHELREGELRKRSYAEVILDWLSENLSTSLSKLHGR